MNWAIVALAIIIAGWLVARTINSQNQRMMMLKFTQIQTAS
jgi:hypothetical protein